MKTTWNILQIIAAVVTGVMLAIVVLPFSLVDRLLRLGGHR